MTMKPGSGEGNLASAHVSDAGSRDFAALPHSSYLKSYAFFFLLINCIGLKRLLGYKGNYFLNSAQLGQWCGLLLRSSLVTAALSQARHSL